MILGLTYDLKDDYLARGFDEETVAELDRRETIEAIDETLQGLGYDTVRIGGLEALVARLARGERWDLVFNVAEGLYGYGREAQVPALLDGYRIPYTFSDPLTLAVTLHKGLTKRIARDHRVPTADFAVIERPAEARRLHRLSPPLFVKPVAEGSSKGISERSLVLRREDLEGVCAALIAAHRQPVIVETFLPGREFTVGMVGTGATASVLGVLEIVVHDGGGAAYSLAVKSSDDYHALVSYRLCPEPALTAECERVALTAWRALRCRDAGRVDLRCDAGGRPMLLEVNPLAGLRPQDSDLTILTALLDLPYRELMRRIMAAAHQRWQLPIPQPRAGAMP